MQRSLLLAVETAGDKEVSSILSHVCHPICILSKPLSGSSVEISEAYPATRQPEWHYILNSSIATWTGRKGETGNIR